MAARSVYAFIFAFFLSVPRHYSERSSTCSLAWRMALAKAAASLYKYIVQKRLHGCTHVNLRFARRSGTGSCGQSVKHGTFGQFVNMRTFGQSDIRAICEARQDLLHGGDGVLGLLDAYDNGG